MYLFPILYLDLYVLRFCHRQTSDAVMQAIVNVNVTREAKLFFAFETLTQHTSRRVHDDATAIALSEKKTIVFTVANLLSLLRFLVRIVYFHLDERHHWEQVMITSRQVRRRHQR